jgi:hypothetical protein
MAQCVDAPLLRAQGALFDKLFFVSPALTLFLPQEFMAVAMRTCSLLPVMVAMWWR